MGIHRASLLNPALSQERAGSLRVLQVIPGVAARYGGPSQAIFRMCQALESEGAEVMLVSTDADGRGRLRVPLAEPIVYNGVRTIFFPRQYSEGFKYSMPLARWLESNAAEFDVAAIHAVFSHSSLAAARACNRSGIPYIVRPLGSLSDWSLGQKPLRKRLFWRLGVNKMLRGAAAIHYTSKEEMRSAQAVLPNASGEVIPLGIDSYGEAAVQTGRVVQAGRVSNYDGWGVESSAVCTDELDRESQDKLAACPTSDCPYVLALCRVHPVKCLDLLIDAFLAAAQRQQLNWRLVIAGDGDPGYLAQLKSQVASRGAEKAVLFRGWLQGKEKSETMRGASLVALTSRHENFGLSAAEALAFGVPVLVSTNVSLAEQIDEAGAGWITTLDRHSVAAALAEAMSSDAERKSRGRAALLLAGTFSWDAIGKRLYRFYSSAVATACRQACCS